MLEFQCHHAKSSSSLSHATTSERLCFALDGMLIFSAQAASAAARFRFSAPTPGAVPSAAPEGTALADPVPSSTPLRPRRDADAVACLSSRGARCLVSLQGCAALAPPANTAAGLWQVAETRELPRLLRCCKPPSGSTPSGLGLPLTQSCAPRSARAPPTAGRRACAIAVPDGACWVLVSMDAGQDLRACMRGIAPLC
jgi:hypothetical protein